MEKGPSSRAQIELPTSGGNESVPNPVQLQDAFKHIEYIRSLMRQEGNVDSEDFQLNQILGALQNGLITPLAAIERADKLHAGRNER